MRFFGFGLSGRGLLRAAGDYLWAKRLGKLVVRLPADAFLADADYLLAIYSLNDYEESWECYWRLAFRFEDGRREGVHDVARSMSLNLCIYSQLWLNDAPIEAKGSTFIVRIESMAYSPAIGFGHYFAKNMAVLDSGPIGPLV